MYFGLTKPFYMLLRSYNMECCQLQLLSHKSRLKSLPYIPIKSFYINPQQFHCLSPMRFKHETVSLKLIKIESFEESTKAEAMGEMTQEPGFEIPNQEEDDLKLQEPINLSLLHLDNFKNNQQNRHSCTTCACNVTASNPMKRPSPESIAEHKSKKPLLENHYSLSGFSKIPLPLLQRSTSDPYTPTKPNLSDTAKALEDTPLSKGSASSSLPPRAPVLSRSISDPIFSPAKSLSRSSSSYEMGVELIKEESPSAKVGFLFHFKLLLLFSWSMADLLYTRMAEIEENEGADERNEQLVG